MVDYLDTLGKDAYQTLEAPYGIGAAGISAALPALVDPYASTGRNFGVTLGAGLLAGLLGGMGRSSAQSQNQALMFQGEQMSTLPVLQQRAMVQEEPRLAGIYSALRAAEQKRAENLFNLKQSKGVELEFAPQIAAAMLPAEQKKLLMGKNIDLIMNPQIAAATELGTIPAKRAAQISQNLTNAAGQQGVVENPNYDPNDPESQPWLSYNDPKIGLKKPVDFEIEKAAAIEEDKRERDFARLGFSKDKAEQEDKLKDIIKEIPIVKQLTIMERELPALEAFVKDTKSSDMAFLYKYIKALDDGAVKEGELGMAQTSNPLLTAYRKQIEGVFSGRSGLTVELKRQMLEELKASRELQIKAAIPIVNRELDYFKDRGVAIGADRDKFIPFGRNLTFGDSAAPKTQIVKDASGNQYQWDPAANKLKRIVK